MKGSARRRGGGRLDRGEKSIVFPPAERQRAQEEQRRGVWDTSKYLTDFSDVKTLRPATLPAPPPPDRPASLSGPRQFKGAAQCAPTPCNEISSRR